MFLNSLDMIQRQRVDDLVVLYQKKDGRIPVNMESLISIVSRVTKKEIDVEYLWDKPPQSRGYIFPGKKSFSIRINTANHLFIQRITLAHEISHIFISYDISKNLITKKKFLDECLGYNYEKERMCNMLAIYFLCPPNILMKLLMEFHLLPYQLDLYKEEKSTCGRLKIIANWLEIPVRDFVMYAKKVYGYSKFKPLLNLFTP